MPALEPESFYRAPASALAGNEPAGPGPIGRFTMGTALGAAWRTIRAQYFQALSVVIVFFVLVGVSYLSCIGLVLFLPHFSTGLNLAGISICRGENGFGQLFRPFQRYPVVLAVGLIGGGIGWLIQFLPFVVHLALRPDSSDFLEAEYFESLNELFSYPVLTLSLVICTFGRLYWSMRFLPLVPLLVERRLPLRLAMRTAWRATAPDQLSLLGFQLLLFVMTWIGLGLFCAGYIVIGPVVMLLRGAALRQLLGESSASETDGPRRPGNATTNADASTSTSTSPPEVTEPPDQANDRNPYY